MFWKPREKRAVKDPPAIIEPLTFLGQTRIHMRKQHPQPLHLRPLLSRTSLSLIGAGLLVFLSACVSGTEAEEQAAPPVIENTDTAEEIPQEPSQPPVDTVRDVPSACDFDTMGQLGWFELEKNENLDPARFHVWLTRPDPSETKPDSLRCVYGGDGYHDLLVVEFQPLTASAAAAHQDQLIAASYREAVMSTDEVPMFFRAQVSLDNAPMVLPSDIPGFQQDMCWDMVNHCVTEVVMYGPGMWVAVAWASAAWEGDTEARDLRALRDYLLEG